MSGFDFAALERRIAALEANRGASLRFGVVTGVNTKDGSVRVQLPDGDNMVSAPLRVLQRRSLKDKAQCLPDIGEPVACLFSGQGLESGVVLGAHYSTQTPAPGQQASTDYVVYEDGTEIWYDRKAHKLIARVRGEVSIRSLGELVAESASSITLKAPHIRLEGEVSVLKGSLSVPDGDVSGGGVSLGEHTHGGVESGPAESGPPKNEDTQREQAFAGLTDIYDRLVRCMPEMVANEAQRTLEQGNMTDHQGWLYLHEGIMKWLHGKAWAMPDDKYNNGGQEPLWVEWDWLMQYARFRKALAQLLQPEYLFEDDAKANLTRFLREEGAFEGKGKVFDHINLPWRMWRQRAIQGKVLAIDMSFQGFMNAKEIFDEKAFLLGQIKPDGFQVAIANTTIYGLTAGHTEKTDSGAWRIVVEKVACFIHDGFDFNGEHWVGNWICADLTREEILEWHHLENVPDDVHEDIEEWVKSIAGKSQFDIAAFALYNKDFRQFRDVTGYGCDFRTMCKPQLVSTEEFFYDI